MLLSYQLGCLVLYQEVVTVFDVIREGPHSATVKQILLSTCSKKYTSKKNKSNITFLLKSMQKYSSKVVWVSHGRVSDPSNPWLPSPSCIWDWTGRCGSACPGGAGQRWQVATVGSGRWRGGRGPGPGSNPGSVQEHGKGQRRRWCDQEAEAAPSWKPPTWRDGILKDQSSAAGNNSLHFILHYWLLCSDI